MLRVRLMDGSILGQTRLYKLIVVASHVRTQQYGAKNKDQLAQIIMCPRGATCLLSDCCFGEMALKIQLREFVWYRVGTITICQKVTVSHHDTVNKSLM